MTIDRIKEIQAETAYPNSTSVQQALLKVWNECKQEQEQVKNCSIPDVVGQSKQLKKFLHYVANASSFADRNKMNREAEQLLNKLF